MRILSQEEVELAAQWLRAGEIVAFPTETVYGLGAAIFNPSAIEKIYQAKNRPSDNPLIAHVSDFCQVDRIAESLPDEFFLLAERFWPGPLTMLVAKTSAVPDVASAGLTSIGVRMPNHPLALRLIEEVGEPLVAPSANVSGRPSATCVSHVLEDFMGKIVAVIEGGNCQVGLESTVLDLNDPRHPQILRPGAITAKEIASVLGVSIEMDESKADEAKPRSPGMKYRHYAPKARVSLYTSAKELEKEWAFCPTTTQVLAPMGVSLLCPYLSLLPQTLYAELRAADHRQCDRILILCNEATLRNPALMNRLIKASS